MTQPGCFPQTAPCHATLLFGSLLIGRKFPKGRWRFKLVKLVVWRHKLALSVFIPSTSSEPCTQSVAHGPNIFSISLENINYLDVARDHIDRINQHISPGESIATLCRAPLCGYSGRNYRWGCRSLLRSLPLTGLNPESCAGEQILY